MPEQPGDLRIERVAITHADAQQLVEAVQEEYVVRYGSRPAKVLALARKAFGGRYDDATILRWLRLFVQRFFSQQFKRSAMPDGPKVGDRKSTRLNSSHVSESRMPSSA